MNHLLVRELRRRLIADWVRKGEATSLWTWDVSLKIIYLLANVKMYDTPAHQTGPDKRPPGRPGADRGGEWAQGRWGTLSPGAGVPWR